MPGISLALLLCHLAGGVLGNRDLCCCYFQLPWQLLVEAWLEGPLLQLALEGPAGDLKDALLCRHLGCCVVDCV